MIFEEKLISSERIYEGKILNVRRDKVTVPTGEAYREVIEHNGAVAMVAVNDDGNIVLVRQFRYAGGRTFLEIPAGKIDKGEKDPVDAAVRELKEETGYSAGDIKYLGKINVSVAYSEEVIYLYLMRDLTSGLQCPDENEVVEVVEMPFEEAYEMAQQGKIEDAKTAAALLMAKAQM